MGTAAVICLLLTCALLPQSHADPDFRVFQEDLLLQVHAFEKSDAEVAYLVSFLNPTEQVVTTSFPVQRFLPQSLHHERLIVVPRDLDFSDYIRKVIASDEFRVKLHPQEQRTYTFLPETAALSGQHLPVPWLQVLQQPVSPVVATEQQPLVPE